MIPFYLFLSFSCSWIVASQSYGLVKIFSTLCFKLLLHLAADLEPPKPRPKTSARTAQRLIAHGMGLKQFTNFGTDELKKQEEERKNRIAARQSMRDEAWGSD
jgi:hypothetical protein